MKNILSVVLGLAGLVLGVLPLILTVLCVFLWQPISYLKCFLFYAIFSAINDAIMQHTAYYIYYHIPLVSTRTILQNRIVSGEAKFSEKIKGIIAYTFMMLFFDKLHLVTALIVSAIIFGCMLLFQKLF